MTGAGLTFVTVVYETELMLLHLQARSLAAFVPDDLVHEVVVIDNTARGMPADARRALGAEYGRVADRLRVLRPDDVRRVPATTGWRSQQVLKLCVADLVSSERYVVLDAKNHFVAPLEPGHFQAPDGRPRGTAYGYAEHPLRPSLERVLRYLGLDPADHLHRFTATVTPFVLDTGTVRSVVRGVESRSGRDFADEFVAQELTEFFLYAGWIVARGDSLDEVYDLGQPSSPTVWPRSADEAGVAAAVRAAQERRAPVFAVHRRALAALDAPSAAALAAFWAGRGLFGSPQAAEAFVADFQREHARLSRQQRLRELPRRLRTLVRRLLRRRR